MALDAGGFGAGWNLQESMELVVEGCREELERVVVRVQLVDPEFGRLDRRQHALDAHEDQLVRVLPL